MDTAQRRAAVLRRLTEAAGPVKASELAGEMSVTRQVIVKDVALLRAEGHDILATPRGYVVEKEDACIRHTVACSHRQEDMEEELNAMVDQGCTVENVIVEHPVYGQLTGSLNLASRHDVREFIARSAGASPLCMLTGGIHLHTLICPDEEAFRRVKAALRRKGILLE